MNLSIYNENLDRVAIIGNQYVSCLWSEGYNTVESFSLEVIATDEYKKKIKTDFFVGRADRKTLMVIKSVRIEDGRIVASGKQATRVLDDIAVVGLIEPGEDVDTSIGNAYNNSTGFPGMVFSSTDISEAYNDYVGNQSMQAVCETICQETDVGFKVERNGKSLVFSLYQPTPQENLVFSERFGNLSIDSVLFSTEKLKNYAIVIGLDETDTPFQINIDRTGGDRRRELVVDATGVMKESNDTNASFMAKVAAVGVEELNKYTNIFSCSFIPNEKDFGTKYDLGDVITVYLNEYGIKLRARVKKFTQKSQKNKITTTVEVGQIVIKR